MNQIPILKQTLPFKRHQETNLMIISLIVAVGAKGEIGADNQLLWKLSEDLKTFRRLTMGHHMLMGRKTWDSIGKALPGRTSLVVSRQDLSLPENAFAFKSVEDAIRFANEAGDNELFIIGGGEIYKQALSLSSRIYLSRVHQSYPEADTWFPDIDFNDWDAKDEKNYPETFTGPAWTWSLLEKTRRAHH